MKSPRTPFRRDVRNFLTPLKSKDENSKSPNQPAGQQATTIKANKKYAHIQSKVKTFWTPQEMDKAGVKEYFGRKGTSSASSSACSSIATSPDTSRVNISMSSVSIGRLQHQLSGPDFTARINELRKGISGSTSNEPNMQAKN